MTLPPPTPEHIKALRHYLAQRGIELTSDELVNPRDEIFNILGREILRGQPDVMTACREFEEYLDRYSEQREASE